MNKKCCKCGKTVYPTEELRCLDKIWHKACFKCVVCGMTLNMKNYKGYDKQPYCNAHYPQGKHTAVADTPEARRIAENTKIQSNIKYHADFEKQKGHKTSVADDPETARIKQNTANQSNVNYWGVKDMREQMETKRPTETVDDAAEPVAMRNPAQTGSNRPGSHAYGVPFSYGGSPPGGRPGSHRPSQTAYSPEPDLPPPPPQAQQQPYSYGDMNQSRGSNYGNQSSGGQRGFSYTPQPAGGGYNPTDRGSKYNDRSSGYGDRISGYGDRSSGYGDAGYRNDPPVQAPLAAPPQAAPPQPQPVPQPARVAQPPPPRQPCFQAIYDYTAADTDEVSFVEGDLIINSEKVDEGWMMGTVQRTGLHGMLPSNYVEQV